MSRSRKRPRAKPERKQHRTRGSNSESSSRSSPGTNGAVSSITVRVSPKSCRSGVSGWMDDGTLKVKVLAAPEGGRANIELLRVVAEELRIPVRNVTIESGITSTTKTLKIQGLDEDEVKRRLER
jgi:uncharacterized protein (TIGR00251 family)